MKSSFFDNKSTYNNFNILKYFIDSKKKEKYIQYYEELINGLKTESLKSYYENSYFEVVYNELKKFDT